MIMNRTYDIESHEGQQLVTSEPTSSWGGSWTEEKLDAFEKYVNAYLTIMNKYRDQYQWKLISIFHFACASNNPNAVKIAHEIINK